MEQRGDGRLAAAWRSDDDEDDEDDDDDDDRTTQNHAKTQRMTTSNFPPSFRAFVRELDATASRAVDKDEWWAAHCAAHPEWTYTKTAAPAGGPTALAKLPIESLFFETPVTRELFPTEFIIGYGSPIYLRRSRSPDDLNMVSILYLHFWGGNSGGTGAGGLTATIMDDAVSGLALYYAKQWCATKSLECSFVRPLRPVPGLCRAISRVTLHDRAKNEIHVEGEIQDAQGRVCVRGKGVMVPTVTGAGLAKTKPSL